LDILADEQHAAQVRYLSRRDVIACCAGIDPVEVVAQALIAHEQGGTQLPDEAYLGWRTPDGYPARCLAMPGAVDGPDGMAYGLKVINGSLANTTHGLPRSQGFTMVFDPQTARPLAVMEAAYISALRTAAVTAVTAQRLGTPGVTSLAMVGCGTLARAHLATLPGALPNLSRVHLFDVDPLRAKRLAEQWGGRSPEVTVATSARECVAAADLVVTVTTVTEGYLPYEWLRPGALVAHVSLDDVLPDVVERADVVLVDDWNLVSGDPRRLLGRMYRQGQLLAPDGRHHPGRAPEPSARRVDARIGQVLTGAHPGRRSPTDIVLSNPFGMAVLDVAIAARVHAAARARGVGVWLEV
jgi:ornithine cyclodeaminase/alanine dehydrogenase-like protein (mu-crystallin family)